MKIAKITIALLLSLGSTLSQAAVFTENFNGFKADQLNWNPAGANGWEVGPTVNDTVDLIGQGGGFDLLPGNGSYVDLDGSTGSSGVLRNFVDLIAGTQYTLSFWLAGNQRADQGTESVNVHFGGVNQTFNLSYLDPFKTFSLIYTPTVTNTYSFGFTTNSNDNVGALLDNVSVTAVPEPETYALMLAGLGLIGFSARRRKTHA
ncbi:MAG TPA: PEPxxWA-CTERM sorting domain-containing protein [Methylophilaceae bacterium]|nr:PEPxxWA-CTERM sorting domain-containing protein [Methylophilaceae bacterium]